jgi:hypothetical protein
MLSEAMSTQQLADYSNSHSEVITIQGNESTAYLVPEDKYARLVEVPCRCKDCNYSERIRTKRTNNLHCHYWDHETGMLPNEVDENGFCSNAELRESN